MERSSWLLLAWTVFGVGVASKLWRIGIGLRRPGSGPGPVVGPSRMATEPFRQSLERIWAKGEDA